MDLCFPRYSVTGPRKMTPQFNKVINSFIVPLSHPQIIGSNKRADLFVGGTII